MIWYDMTWQDMTWYDKWYDLKWYMIWHDIWSEMIHDLIWYDIWSDMMWCDMIYIDILCSFGTCMQNLSKLSQIKLCCKSCQHHETATNTKLVGHSAKASLGATPFELSWLPHRNLRGWCCQAPHSAGSTCITWIHMNPLSFLCKVGLDLQNYAMTFLGFEVFEVAETLYTRCLHASFGGFQAECTWQTISQDVMPFKAG